MELPTTETTLAVRQLPRLKRLLNKYRQNKTMQSALLQLSELASAVTDMDAFYNALESVIKTLLVTDSFHIALLNSSNELKLTHCHNPLEKGLCEQVDLTHWQKSLSGLVVMRQQKLHCSANKRRVLAVSYTHLTLPTKRIV